MRAETAVFALRRIRGNEVERERERERVDREIKSRCDNDGTSPASFAGSPSYRWNSAITDRSEHDGGRFLAPRALPARRSWLFNPLTSVFFMLLALGSRKPRDMFEPFQETRELTVRFSLFNYIDSPERWNSSWNVIGRWERMTEELIEQSVHRRQHSAEARASRWDTEHVTKLFSFRVTCYVLSIVWLNI